MLATTLKTYQGVNYEQIYTKTYEGVAYESTSSAAYEKSYVRAYNTAYDGATYVQGYAKTYEGAEYTATTSVGYEQTYDKIYAKTYQGVSYESNYVKLYQGVNYQSTSSQNYLALTQRTMLPHIRVFSTIRHIPRLIRVLHTSRLHLRHIKGTMSRPTATHLTVQDTLQPRLRLSKVRPTHELKR